MHFFSLPIQIRATVDDKIEHHRNQKTEIGNKTQNCLKFADFAVLVCNANVVRLANDSRGAGWKKFGKLVLFSLMTRKFYRQTV